MSLTFIFSWFNTWSFAHSSPTSWRYLCICVCALVDTYVCVSNFLVGFAHFGITSCVILFPWSIITCGCCALPVLAYLSNCILFLCLLRTPEPLSNQWLLHWRTMTGCTWDLLIYLKYIFTLDVFLQIVIHILLQNKISYTGFHHIFLQTGT